MSPDIRRILLAQALRAVAYGFGSVLLGASLEAQGWSTTQVDPLLTAVVAGTAVMSLVVGTYGDRVGRRRGVLRYAKKWGPLYLCEAHGLPVTHAKPVSPFSSEGNFGVSCSPSPSRVGSYSEPVER